MTRDDLLNRMRDEEDNFVERKPAGVNGKEIRRTVVAFANSVPSEREAVLFIGIRESGSIENCVNPDSTQKTINDICSQECYPPISFRSEVLKVGGNAVIAVVIPASANRPHFAGPAYVRRGSQSVTASDEMFEELIRLRSGKVAALSKLKNSMVSIVSLQHRLGDARILDGSGHRESAECSVIDVDAHKLRLKIVASGQMVSEPLESITLSYDEERHRPLLIVKGL